MAILFGAPVFMPGDGAAGQGEAHGSQSTDYVALAAKHVAKGYAAGYAPKPPAGDRASARAARDAFRQAGVRIAEVGCWTNLLADDPNIRNANFQQMAEAFAQADEMEAVCVIACVGSVRNEGVDHHDARNFSQEAFDTTVRTAQRLIDTVRPKHAKLTFEALSYDFTDTPAGVRRLVETIDRAEVAVHVDLVNWLMTSPRRYFSQHAVIGEIVEQLGPWIVAAHCKDLRMQVGYDQMIPEVPLGQGHLDLRAYLRALDSIGRDVTLLLEHLPDEAAYDAATARVRQEALAAGVHLQRPGESDNES